MFWKYLAPISILRFLGIFLSTSIVLFFNLNWIFGKPADGWLFLISAALTVVIARQAGIFSRIDIPEKREIRIFIAMLVLLSAAWIAYFDGRLDAPRYITPDPGTHYLYMSQTAEMGYLSSFLPDMMYAASGENEVFRNHSRSYFPGASVPFSLIYRFMPERYEVASLQVFNGIFFSLSAVYLFFLVRQSRLIRSGGLLIIVSMLIGLGTIFDLVPMSFSTQLFGLFMLIFFFDAYRAFPSGWSGMLVSSLALSGVILSYLFWLPVAALFMGAYLIGNRDIRRPIVVPALSVILALGYIAVLYDVSVLSHAIDDGGFKSAEVFLSDMIFILPLAIFGIAGIFRDLLRRQNVFFAALALAPIAYSLLLGIAFFFGIVSRYAALKSLYLAIPLMWIAALMQIEKIYRGKWRIKGIFQSIRSGDFPAMRKNAKYILGTVFIFLGCIAYAGSGMEVFPVIRQNASRIIAPDVPRNITAEQMRFLDSLKAEYGWALDDGRILVIAPADTSLWVYAYAGIWPRTSSLLVNAENSSVISPMSFHSEGIADYAHWLENDERHILVLFDTKASRTWQKRNAFRMSDYDTLFSVGNNYLLRLKKPVTTEFLHQEKRFGDSSGQGKISMPYSGEITLSHEKLTGISFALSLKQKKISEDMLFNIRSGSCQKNGTVLYERVVSKEDLRALENDEYFLIRFDASIAASVSDMVCYSLYQGNNDDSVRLIADPQQPDTPLMKELYLYENR